MESDTVFDKPHTSPANRQFRAYAEKVLGRKPVSTSTLEAVMNEKNLFFIKVACIVILCVNTFWLAADYLSGGIFHILTPLGITSILIMDAAAVSMIVFACRKPVPDSPSVTWSFFIFYLIIFGFIAGITINRNMYVEAAGAVSPFIGIYLVSYFAIIVSLMPMYKKRHSIALGIVFVTLSFLPGLPFVPGATVFNPFEQVVMTAAFICAYVLVRRLYLLTSANTVALQNSNNNLMSASYIDPLTQILNRRALNEYIDWIRENSVYDKIGVILYDIDDFKKYNDTYSHVRGDEVLTIVSQNVAKECTGDEYVFRYGGEEFIIILPEADDEKLIEHGKKINEAVWNANIARDDISSGRVTITAGCAAYSFAMDTLKNDIVSAADNQLYLGKRSGKDCTVCCNKIYRVNEVSEPLAAEVEKLAEPAASGKNIALIIDDVEMNREILSDIISEKFQVVEAEDGMQALEELEKYSGRIALMFLDLMMPRLDGFGVLRLMKEQGLTDTIPVFIISGDTSMESELCCLDYGVADFVPKPFNAALLKMRVSNALERFGYRDLLENKVAEQLDELQKANAALLRTNENIIEIVGDLVEARSMETGLHVRRIKGFTRALATQVMQKHPEFGLTERKIEIMVSVCALHDVGKIMISDAILHKPGRFTPEEFAIMKTHTILGCEIIDSAKNMWGEEYYTTAYEICRYHHERADGSGYPDGLKGDEIPISAQIVSVADVYDALVAERVYKKPYSCEQAYNMIMNGECGAFSSVILDSFSGCREEFEVLSHTIVAARFERGT